MISLNTKRPVIKLLVLFTEPVGNDSVDMKLNVRKGEKNTVNGGKLNDKLNLMCKRT